MLCNYFKGIVKILSSCEKCHNYFQVRNLCYMVNKREKVRHQLYRMKEEIFHVQAAQVLQGPFGKKTADYHLVTEGHRMTGTFYDHPKGILEAAQRMELDGQLIDQKNLNQIAEEACAKRERRTARPPKARGTRGDGSTAVGPCNPHIQQLFKEKTDSFSSRGGSEVEPIKVPEGAEVLSETVTEEPAILVATNTALDKSPKFLLSADEAANGPIHPVVGDKDMDSTLTESEKNSAEGPINLFLRENDLEHAALEPEENSSVDGSSNNRNCTESLLDNVVKMVEEEKADEDNNRIEEVDGNARHGLPGNDLSMVDAVGKIGIEEKSENSEKHIAVEGETLGNLSFSERLGNDTENFESTFKKATMEQCLLPPDECEERVLQLESTEPEGEVISVKPKSEENVELAIVTYEVYKSKLSLGSVQNEKLAEVVWKPSEFDAKLAELSVKPAELNAKSTELDVPVNELDVKSTGLYVKSAELLVEPSEPETKSAELDVTSTKLDVKLTEINAKSTELHGKLGELSVTSAELDVKSTELDERSTELDENPGEFCVTAVELDVKLIEFDIKSDALCVKSTLLDVKSNELDVEPAAPAVKSAELDVEPAAPAVKSAELDVGPTAPAVKLAELDVEPAAPALKSAEIDVKVVDMENGIQNAASVRSEFNGACIPSLPFVVTKPSPVVCNTRQVPLALSWDNLLRPNGYCEDLVKRDLRRRFTPSQLVVSEAIKEKVRCSFAQIASRMSIGSFPSICQHTRTKLSEVLSAAAANSKNGLGPVEERERRHGSTSSPSRPPLGVRSCSPLVVKVKKGHNSKKRFSIKGSHSSSSDKDLITVVSESRRERSSRRSSANSRINGRLLPNQITITGCSPRPKRRILKKIDLDYVSNDEDDDSSRPSTLCLSSDEDF